MRNQGLSFTEIGRRLHISPGRAQQLYLRSVAQSAAPSGEGPGLAQLAVGVICLILALGGVVETVWAFAIDLPTLGVIAGIATLLLAGIGLLLTFW